MKDILVPIDFSDVTDRVVERAAGLAKALAARLWLLHVAMPDPDFVGYDVGPPSARQSRATELRDEHRALQAIAERLRADGIEATSLLVQGPTVETILAEAGKVSADLIAVGSHGHGALHRALVGSVSEGLLRHADRPLLIVPARPATDGSETE